MYNDNKQILSVKYFRDQGKLFLAQQSLEKMLSPANYDRLLNAYHKSGNRTDTDIEMGEFHERLFILILRYETLTMIQGPNRTGSTLGPQASLPVTAFDALKQMFGVVHECHASPLNATVSIYFLYLRTLHLFQFHLYLNTCLTCILYVTLHITNRIIFFTNSVGFLLLYFSRCG